MKLSAISIAIVVAGVVGTASAAGQSTVMRPIMVSGTPVSECTPPSNAPACAKFHSWIRANFPVREISMLFGASTAYPEYMAGGADRLQRRYQAVVQEYVAAQQVASGVDVAAK